MCTYLDIMLLCNRAKNGKCVLGNNSSIPWKQTVNAHTFLAALLFTNCPFILALPQRPPSHTSLYLPHWLRAHMKAATARCPENASLLQKNSICREKKDKHYSVHRAIHTWSLVCHNDSRRRKMYDVVIKPIPSLAENIWKKSLSRDKPFTFFTLVEIVYLPI